MYYINNRIFYLRQHIPFLVKPKRNLPSSNLDICSKNVNPRERGDCRWWSRLQLSIPTQGEPGAFSGPFIISTSNFLALGCRLFFCLVNFLSGLNVRFRSHSLLGPDYFDEEAKCYGRLFEFCRVTFCHSRQWGRMTLTKF